jgi:hypothetical protein
MTVLFSDDFSAADGDLSAPWYYRSDGYHAQRASGVLTDTNNNGGICFLDAPQDDLDLTVDMTFPATIGSYSDVQIGWKGQHVTGTNFPAGTPYFLFATNLADAPGCTVSYYNGSSLGALFTGGTFVAGTTYTVRIVHAGTDLSIYIDGVLLCHETTVDNPGQDTITLLMNNVGGGQPSFDNFSIAGASTAIVVDFETFHEVEVFYGVAPLIAETFHEVETFYGLVPPIPLVVDLETFHELEHMRDFSFGEPIVVDLLTLHEIEMFYPRNRVAFAFGSPITKVIETAFGLELGNVAFRRWKFHDYLTGETYFFEMNPNSMSTPYPSQQTTSLGKSPIDGSIAATRVVQPAIDWSFSGNIRTESFQVALAYWFEKSNKITLTDHIGRRWIVLPKSFGPYPRPNRRTALHRWRYDAVVISYGRG